MNRIKELRTKGNLTQKEMAAAVGVSPKSVANWETGQHNPNEDFTKKLCEFFKVSEDYLLGKDAEPVKAEAKPAEILEIAEPASVKAKPAKKEKAADVDAASEQPAADEKKTAMRKRRLGSRRPRPLKRPLPSQPSLKCQRTLPSRL